MRVGDERGGDDETPPERASPSFSFHEERRLLKSDEYWLAHKIPRLPPPALGSSPNASIAALDGLSLSRYDVQDDERPSMASPAEDYDPSGVTHHRARMDEDERLELEEETREKTGAMAAGGLPPDQFDTGESPRVPLGAGRRHTAHESSSHTPDRASATVHRKGSKGGWIAADHPPDDSFVNHHPYLHSPRLHSSTRI